MRADPFLQEVLFWKIAFSYKTESNSEFPRMLPMFSFHSRVEDDFEKLLEVTSKPKPKVPPKPPLPQKPAVSLRSTNSPSVAKQKENRIQTMSEVDILQYIQENESINNQDTSLFWIYVFLKPDDAFLAPPPNELKWQELTRCFYCHHAHLCTRIQRAASLSSRTSLWGFQNSAAVALDFQGFAGNVDKDVVLQIVCCCFGQLLKMVRMLYTWQLWVMSNKWSEAWQDAVPVIFR